MVFESLGIPRNQIRCEPNSTSRTDRHRVVPHVNVLAMDELIAMGHRRIGHVGGPIGWTSTTNRELAYRRVLTGRGLPTFPVARGDWSARSGYQAGLAWPVELETTAIFVANDQMALGLLSGLRERGLSVPDQISVVGFDDIQEVEFMAPPLTTVRLDFFDQGVRRIHGLIVQIQGTPPESDPHGGVVELVRRGSIRAVQESVVTANSVG